MRDFRINENELLNRKQFPVKALFDMVSNERFIKVIRGISQGVGFGENYGACVFWNDLDEYDKSNTDKYEGAEFGLHNGEEIIINYDDLYHYLKIVCNKFIEDYPEQKDETELILSDYKKKFIQY